MRDIGTGLEKHEVHEEIGVFPVLWNLGRCFLEGVCNDEIKEYHGKHLTKSQKVRRES